MAEPPTPDNGGVVPLLLLLEDAIDAAELGRWSAMVSYRRALGRYGGSIVGVLGSVKTENRERIWPLLKGEDIVTEEFST